jgi:polygalacturonase
MIWRVVFRLLKTIQHHRRYSPVNAKRIEKTKNNVITKVQVENVCVTFGDECIVLNNGYDGSNLFYDSELESFQIRINNNYQYHKNQNCQDKK